MSLFREGIQDHLTASPIDVMARASFAGMAHFAGSGPNGKTCRECVFWRDGSQHDYASKRGLSGGMIKPHPCTKYRIMTGRVGAKIPDDANACKYFEASKAPPARFNK